MSPVTRAEMEAGDGLDHIRFLHRHCRVTKDSVGGKRGTRLRMRDWQQLQIHRIFARHPDTDDRKHRVGMLGIPRKNGKALDPATPIPTPDGWVKMGDLEVGDQVFDEHGDPCTVVATAEWLDRPIYRVAFDDGTTIVADERHEWPITIWGDERIVETIGLAKLVDGSGSPSINVADELTTPTALEGLGCAYTLGAWLGDGTSASGGVTNEDPEVWEAIQAEGFRLGRPYKLSRTVLGLKPLLNNFGVVRNKHVPDFVMRWSIDQRKAVLAGIIDSDGHITKRGQCEITFTDERLALSTVELIRTLGYKPRYVIHDAAIDGRVVGQRWRIQFWPWAGDLPVRIPRKAKRMKPHPGKRTRSQRRHVVSVEPIGHGPTRCIEVDSPSHLFLAGEGLVPTHNSALVSGLGLAEAESGPEGGEVYCCAGDREQARIVFANCKAMVEMDPELSERVKPYRDRLVWPDTDTQLIVVSSESKLKEGLNPTFIIFDEVHVQPDDELWDVMEQAMGAREEPLMLGITTAGDPIDRNGQDSLCYRLYQHGVKVATNEIDDPSFFFSWWEPYAGDRADWTDPETWAEANPGLGDIVSLADFEAKMKRGPEATVRTKRLNQWVPGKLAAFPAGAWDKVEATKAQRPARRRKVLEFNLGSTEIEVPAAWLDDAVLFLDGSWSGDSTGVMAVRRNGFMFPIVHHEKTELDGPDWRVPVTSVEDDLRQAMDAGARGTLLDPFYWKRTMVTLQEEGYPIAEWPTNSLGRICPAWKDFYAAVIDQDGISHNGDPALARHIANIVLKIDRYGARPVKVHKASTRHIDLAICAIGAWANRDLEFDNGKPERARLWSAAG